MVISGIEGAKIDFIDFYVLLSGIDRSDSSLIFFEL